MKTIKSFDEALGALRKELRDDLRDLLKPFEYDCNAGKLIRKLDTDFTDSKKIKKLCQDAEYYLDDSRLIYRDAINKLNAAVSRFNEGLDVIEKNEKQEKQ